MAGGTFVTRNKVRAGAYINFVSEYSPLGTVSDRGVVLLPMELPFGAVHEAVAVEGDTDVRKLFGLSALSEELLLLREAAKRASKVLVWRLNSGKTAQRVDSGLTVMARYPGSTGNSLTVKIIEPEDGSGIMYVQTFLGEKMVDEQEAAEIGDLQDNAWVMFSGDGELTAHAGIVLEGGSDSEILDEDWEDFFLAAGRLTFNTMAVPTGSSSVKQMAFSFIKRMREDEGIKVQAVVANMAADYEGIISVCNGVTLEDGTQLSAAQTTAYVAGMTAGAAVNKSCTYDRYDGAAGVDRQLLASEIVALLKAGQFVFIQRGDKVIVEQDINTFTGFSPEKGDAFRKNRTLRVMDAIGTDVRTIFEDYYLGKCANDEDGRALFREELFSYLSQLYEVRAVEKPAIEDIVVMRGETADSVIVEMAVQPVDAMEKLYMTVTVGA